VNPKTNAEYILASLNYDFRGFTIENFITWLGDRKGRQIISIPRKMPAGMFGAWFTDDAEPNEYIFYRINASLMLQIHIQLHELAHFLFGHPTIHISRKSIAASIHDGAPLPFRDLVLTRSTKKSKYETEAETLASLIQRQAIHHSHLDQLTGGISSDKNIARYLDDLGMT
jgi:Zn-dependent peptidase ImmA (M78 family)